jgi:hypothetical protein
MSSLPFSLHLSEGQYTSVLAEPAGTRAYLGTSSGCVEVWELRERRKLAELRYLRLDEFGEQVVVEEPVVNLSAPANFEIVYAFFGTAAYCIDVELNVIIHQIPVSERVVWGSVSPVLGEVAILSESGYLSRWSPRFIERVGSIEFPFETPSGYITHDFDESRIILLLQNGQLILTNLEGERYTVHLEYQPANKLFGASWFDRNQDFQLLITNNGDVYVESATVKLPQLSDTSILANGIVAGEYQLRQAIAKMETGEGVREYIQDQRLDRQSKDRYFAELDSINQEMHYSGTTEDDSKTMDFAFKEYNSDNVELQSQALTVLGKISQRHHINTKFAFLAWRLDGGYQLIENARYYEFEFHKRKEKILRFLVYCTLLGFILLLSSQLLLFSGFLGLFFLLPVLIQFQLLVSWRNINTSPRIPDIEGYRAFQIFYWLLLGLSIGLFLFNSILDKNLSIPVIE